MPGHLIRRLHQHSTQIFASHIRDAGLDVSVKTFRHSAAECVAELADVRDGVFVLPAMVAEFGSGHRRITGNRAPEFIATKVAMSEGLGV